MTINEKNEIARLRKAGKSVNDIADELKLSRNTVKSFCRRNNLTGPADQMPDITIPDMAEVKPCLHCGKPVVQTPGRKEKKFCNDICRNRFWNSHLAQVKRKAMYEYYNGPRNPDHIFQNHREHGMIKKTQRRDKP